jgi:hypothetical protein
MIRLITTLLFFIMCTPAFAQRGGGGGDRPRRINLGPIEYIVQEAERRFYCIAYPEECIPNVDGRMPTKKQGGQCGDAYRTVEDAYYYCPAGSNVMKVFLRDLFTCHCYGPPPVEL